jgi:ketosteroid isomerase-like protein
MKKKISIPLILLFTCMAVSGLLKGQAPSAKVKTEITAALEQFNAAAKRANVDETLSLFDNTDDILLVGSDSGEIYKGKEQIRGWLAALFKHNSFAWEMNRIDIDCNGKTAWVFVDGAMVVTNSKGKIRKTPYRFTGIMVKKNKEWKWRLFNGSNPRPE